MQTAEEDKKIMDDVGFRVRTTAFEGPFELLLELVEKRKLFINEISLSQVTEDYINYVKEIKNKNGGTEKRNDFEITGFILIAATLILIKSRSLLPGLALTTDEETDIQDLEARLKLYKLVAELQPWIKENFGKKIIFERGGATHHGGQDFFAPVFAPDKSINKESLRDALLGALDRIPKTEFVPEVTIKKVINIEEMIDKLTERISAGMRTTFKDFSGSHGAENHKEAKVYAIVSFLAMLELVREGILEVMQEGNFQEIIIGKQEQELTEI